MPTPRRPSEPSNASSGDRTRLDLVATCALGLEELLAGELAALGAAELSHEPGAVRFCGGWHLVWRANYALRTANRVLVELRSWTARDGEALMRGAFGLVGEDRLAGLPVAELLHPDRTLSVRATVRGSASIHDARWATLKVKDGLVDGQRRRFGRRSPIEKEVPDLPLRLHLLRDRATLLLDTSGESLDRRGYRLETTAAPLRETLAAACVLASGWSGDGPVVDPMCGGGTLLVEAGWFALGRASGWLRKSWAFQGLPGFDQGAFERLRREGWDRDLPDLRLFGVDHAQPALTAAQGNLQRAGLGDRSELDLADAFDWTPPAGPGLVVVNPPYGERLAAQEDHWRRLGDLLKQRYAGWTAAVLAGDPDLGKRIGLKPRRRWPVRNGPLEARILVLDLY